MSRLRHPVPETTKTLQANAADPAKSVWVSANAGSGKTHVLSRRVIRLLLGGADPSRILCLTYTRSAAANMAMKVFDDLAAWAVMPDIELAQEIRRLEGGEPGDARLRAARRLFARALETPGGLKIQTIHAFCEAVLHQFPLEANIAGHFELLDTQTEAELVGEARRNLLASVAEENDPALADAFRCAVSVAGEGGFDELLGEIVAKRDHLRRVIGGLAGSGGAGVVLRRHLGIGDDETPATIAASIETESFFTAEFAGAYRDHAERAGKRRAADFAAGLSQAFSQADLLGRFRALSDMFLKDEEGAHVPRSASHCSAKGVTENFPGFAQEFERFAGILLEARDRMARLGMIEATVAAMTLADRLISRYERLKSARGFLDFNDLIVRTVELLSRPDAGPWVQYKLDRGLDHILIDEAQDTSPDQWQVIRKLAEEFFAGTGARGGVTRTVFAVGDEKQSIYSFQGAEPAAFAETGIEFGARIHAARGAFERVQLRHSFRSVADVLTAVDRVFALDRARGGLTLYPEDISHVAIRASDPGHVEIWPMIGAETAEQPEDWTQPIDHASQPAVRLAEAVAERISAWLVDGEILPGKRTRMRPGDIMVLVRKRDSFVHALSRALKTRRVAVAGADRLMLRDNIAVRDLIALGRFVLQPDDDLSLAALLRSPVFEFSDADLFALAHGRGRRSLWRNLLRAAAKDERLKQAARKLSRWRSEAGYKSVFEFYAAILGRDGVRSAMLARLGGETGEILDEFVNFIIACGRTDPMGLGTFLENLETSSPEIKREIAQSRNEVRIMTVHAAKGLEAPVVFLVDNGSKPFSASHLPRLIPYRERSGNVAPELYLWRAGKALKNRLSRELEDQIRQKQEDEYRRLLYVAMTRAEDRLIVCGYHGQQSPGDGNWHRLVTDALAEVGETIPAEGTHLSGPIIRFAVTPPPTSVATDEMRAPAAAAPVFPRELFGQLPADLELPRPLAPSGAGAIVEDRPAPPASVLSPVFADGPGPALAMERGVAIHKLLQYLPDIAQAQRESAARTYLERIGAGWSEADRADVWNRVSAILSDKRFASVFAEGSRAEVAIAGHLTVRGEERSVTGRIDRLAISGSGIFFVDYKTGRQPPCTHDEIQENHVAQIAIYGALLRRIYPGRAIAAGILFTETARLFEIAESAMDASLERLAAT